MTAGKHPRICGEYAAAVVVFPVPPGTPPLARGILPIRDFLAVNKRTTPLARGIRHKVCLIRMIYGTTPACAGNTLIEPRSAATTRDHPRLRGECAVLCIYSSHITGTTPLTRGIRVSEDLKILGIGNTPACAGNTPCPSGPEFRRAEHPRLRGEYLRRDVAKLGGTGPPPQARGIPRYVAPAWS